MIVLNNIVKSFILGEQELTVLKGVNMRVEDGEMVAIMGASGSGKSTLLNLLGCLDVPTSGEYFLEGKEVSKLTRDELADVRGQKIGFIFQQFNLLPQLSAVANVELGMQYSVGIDRQRALAALDSVGLSDRVSHRPRELSGGQQQRVAIARVLAKKPPIILADEPTGNLDSKAGSEILSILTNLNKEEHITLVMITHDPDIAAHCQRTIRMKDGVII
ncbi:MAG: ABC transporter ATP-binding protein [Dehalococcoidia bacterium]|jgi:putative ABC transport system ATP-binding protein